MLKKIKALSITPWNHTHLKKNFFLTLSSYLDYFQWLCCSVSGISALCLNETPWRPHAKRWLNGSTAVMRDISREPFARTGGLTQKQSLRGFSLTHSGGVPILNACLPFFHGGTTEVKERSNWKIWLACGIIVKVAWNLQGMKVGVWWANAQAPVRTQSIRINKIRRKRRRNKAAMRKLHHKSQGELWNTSQRWCWPLWPV